MANQSTHSEPKVIFNSQISNENGTKLKERKSFEEDETDPKPGFFRRAIPIMPKPLAIVCCFLNILIPGIGNF